jgi:hypothetical protein
MRERGRTAILTFSLFPFCSTITPHTQTTGTIPTGPGLTFTDKASDLAFQAIQEADKAGTTGTPPQPVVDLQLGLAVAAGGLEGLPEDSCLAADFDELKDAVEV